VITLYLPHREKLPTFRHTRTSLKNFSQKNLVKANNRHKHKENAQKSKPFCAEVQEHPRIQRVDFFATQISPITNEMGLDKSKHPDTPQETNMHKA
jgi:hypothetical protein